MLDQQVVGKTADSRKRFRCLRATSPATIFVLVAPRMSRALVVLLGGLWGLASPISAAPNDSGWSARVWQLDDGLPDNRVSGIVQTSDNYLWLATHSGLARFDGVRFQNIPLPIPSRRTRPLIRTMLLGREKRLWLALEGGLVVSLSSESTNLFTATNGLSLEKPIALAQDLRSGVWIGYADGSVSRIADGRVTRFAGNDDPASSGPCSVTSDIDGQVWFSRVGQVGVVHDGNFQTVSRLSERLIQLGQARRGGIWACAGSRLIRYNQNGTAIACGLLPTDRSEVEPTVVFEDQTGAVWVGTSADGLFHYDGTNFTRVGTSHEEIMSLGNDDEGNVWVGTGGGGLNRLRTRAVELQARASGLPTEAVRSICEDKNGVMWAVAANGELARRVGNQWSRVAGEAEGSGAHATCVTSDGSGGIWIGTYRNGLQRWRGGRFTSLRRENGLGGEIVRGLLVDHAGDLWIAVEAPACLQKLHENKFQTFTQPNMSRAIRALAEDVKGTIWCGTTDGLLLRTEGDKLRSDTPQISSPPPPIRCLNAAPDGGLWIGYAGAGLGVWRDGKFTHISEEQGLYDSYICSIATDESGGFWCSSDHGIFQVSLHELEAVAEGRAERVHSVPFGRDEGLHSLQGSYGYAPDAARSGDGRLWFPMRTGLAVVNPSLTLVDRAAPRVLIERIAVDGRLAGTDARGRFVFPSANRRLDVDFTAPTFIAPENVRFRYRIESLDEDWIESGARRSATYLRVPAGEYAFHVAACNSAGIWNEPGTTIALTVPPFLWDRWSVRAACLALFTVGVIAAVRYVSFRRLRFKLLRLEQETSLQRERARIAQDLHDDIGASLTHIALLSELAQKDFEKPVQAKEHIDQIFRSARKVVRALDQIVWTVNPKNDTLELFVAFLCTYVPDYLGSAKIRCRLDVPMDVPPIPLQPEVGHHLYLAVKESLHNVVKHAGATEVWLSLQLTEETMTVVVEDNGRGFEIDGKVSPDADGLANLKRRLTEIGGRCDYRSEHGKGTTTTFTAPLKNPAR
ncbi:MAG TPA: two-component regulator propeller domain-containing protein [Candidatus Acidoferrum sp.]|jgi:signal transduction histidine kinase/ligand-binding sensor domain-containing protein|nr:two-component regulator propeller domain-containing protein [Candidatus Acidoferrum sp.]